jgi:hypothetical protein
LSGPRAFATPSLSPTPGSVDSVATGQRGLQQQDAAARLVCLMFKQAMGQAGTGHWNA